MRKQFRLTDEMREDDPLVAARAYIKAGLKIVATHGIDAAGRCTCGDRNCPNPGKHPLAEFFPNGAKSATSDMGLVRRAFIAEPDANLAVTLEELTVVDIDGPEGKAALEALALPKTICAKTHRGRHQYYRGSCPGGSFKANQIDVITGPNRYVMVPPSIHEAGIQYRWSAVSADEARPVPSTLGTLKQRPAAFGQGRTKRLIRVGERNDVLFRMACAIRRHVNDDDIILNMMRIANEQLCEEPLGMQELQAAIGSSGRYSATDEALFGAPIQRKPLPMKWLWYPYFPRYGLTILAGDPGRGKSLLTAMLIATVTSGTSWPLSQERATGRRVLLLSAEDNWARVTLPRLLKAGADIDNIRVMHKFRALTPERLELLAKEMEDWRPHLVVIDTISAYMGAGRDMHRQNEVGEFLAMLTEMAEASGSAVIAVAHLNKQGGEHPLYRIVGSIGFMASIRSALFFGTDPDDPARIALAHGKANASEKGRTISFELVGGGRHDVPILRAIGFSEATEIDVCHIARNDVGRPSLERQAASAFVLDSLTNEPVPWSKVASGASRRNIASEGTLNLVRAELAKLGLIIQEGKGKSAKWRLGATPVAE